MIDLAVDTNSLDLVNWMSKLPDKLKTVPIIYLAIPGSHVSMSYGITNTSGLSPDAEPPMYRFYPRFASTMKKWVRTQKENATEQLRMGIRYFDLRIATKPGTQDFFFAHKMYADEITKPLIEIDQFLDGHPGEIVILDFGFFFGFTKTDHRRLINKVVDMYRPKLVKRPADICSVTLDSMKGLKQQIIVIYRHSSSYNTQHFWEGNMMKIIAPKMQVARFLPVALLSIRRSDNIGFVHQNALTPTPSYVLFRCLSNRRDKMAVACLRSSLPKLATLEPGPPKLAEESINVITADYIELDNASHSRVVIEITYKFANRNFSVYLGD